MTKIRFCQYSLILFSSVPKIILTKYIILMRIHDQTETYISELTLLSFIGFTPNNC